MKKFTALILALMLVLSLCACGETGESKDLGGGSKTVEDVLQEQTAGTSAPAETAAPADEPALIRDADPNVDIDLTAMNSTMVYSEVYNMLATPDNYIGKTIKMRGSFAMYHDEVTDVYYFACIIADATACCSQGIEFVLEGDYSYPEDYPALDEEITVVGTFTTYMEGEYLYCTLMNAHFE